MELVEKTEQFLSDEYSSEDLIKIFEGIFKGEPGDEYEVVRFELWERLMSCNTEYVYRGLKLNWFLYVIGILIEKDVYMHKAKGIATAIVETIFQNYENRQIEAVRSYIQSGKERMIKVPDIINLIEVHC